MFLLNAEASIIEETDAIIPHSFPRCFYGDRNLCGGCLATGIPTTAMLKQ